MTKREKRVQDLRRKIARRERDREQGIKLLVKAVTELPSLRRQLDRLERGWHLKSIEKSERSISLLGAAEHLLETGTEVEAASPRPDDGGIPEFLRRGQAAQAAVDKVIAETALSPEVYEAAHAVANKHNKAPTKEQVDLVAKEKRKVREEVKQAELTGKRRRAPLTGREAEAFLRK